MSITKIAIESTVSVKDYISKIGDALSTYGFTTTYINSNQFYITANISGLDPMYYSLYNSGSWSVQTRKTAPTSSDYNSNYTSKSTNNLTSLGWGQIYTQTMTKNADGTTTNKYYGYIYVLSNSEGDILINLTSKNYTEVEAPTTWFGITSITSIYSENCQVYTMLSNNATSIFTPKDGYEGYICISITSSLSANGFITNGIMLRNIIFYQSLNTNTVDSNYGWHKSLYMVYTTSLSLIAGKIYVINNIQYLAIAAGMLLKIS